jgi:hypothetical protein
VSATEHEIGAQPDKAINFVTVVPAEAGTYTELTEARKYKFPRSSNKSLRPGGMYSAWVPAFAGTTMRRVHFAGRD